MPTPGVQIIPLRDGGRNPDPLRSCMNARFGLIGIVGLAVCGCGGAALLPVSAGEGPQPTLPAPRHSLIPTINVATAVGWTGEATPLASAGTTVNAFARSLQHPRSLLVLPNGDVLVAETNAPPSPDNNTGIKGWFFKRYQKKGGSGVPSANRILMLRDANGDGVAEQRFVLLKDLHSPFGMVLIGRSLYVANTDAIVRYPYTDGDTTIVAAATTVIALPAGSINHHWTKTLVTSRDGATLFVSVGSNSNVAEKGIDKEAERASIWAVDLASGSHRLYATGLRNAVGLAIEPLTGALWASVNERDELGGDLVPDYMTAVREGGFYGWPYSYYGQHVDDRVKPQRPDLVASAIVPDYALGAHTASLGLASSSGTTLGTMFEHGMFIGQHGSWNRTPSSGYKVIFVAFVNGRPSGTPIDVLTGFLNANGDAMGRPVGVAIDRRGALLVADDVGNTVWRVSAGVRR